MCLSLGVSVVVLLSILLHRLIIVQGFPFARRSLHFQATSVGPGIPCHLVPPISCTYVVDKGKEKGES